MQALKLSSSENIILTKFINESKIANCFSTFSEKAKIIFKYLTKLFLYTYNNSTSVLLQNEYRRR